jgi:hypothetical protein
MRMSSVGCPTLHYISTLSHKWQDFRKKNDVEHKMCVEIFFTTFVKTFFILRGTERNMIKNYSVLYVKYTAFLSDFNET